MNGPPASGVNSKSTENRWKRRNRDERRCCELFRFPIHRIRAVRSARWIDRAYSSGHLLVFLCRNPCPQRLLHAARRRAKFTPAVKASRGLLNVQFVHCIRPLIALPPTRSSRFVSLLFPPPSSCPALIELPAKQIRPSVDVNEPGYRLHGRRFNCRL